MLKKNEAWLMNSIFIPSLVICSHVLIDKIRDKKLLLHKFELRYLYGHVKRKGYTIIPEMFFWDKGNAKVRFGLCKGKKKYDKRNALKEREWKNLLL